MDAIASYMNHRQFPFQLRSKVRKHFQKLYDSKSAIDEQAILGELDQHLQQEVGEFM